MPIYEYTCKACNEIFALLQRSSEEKGTTCPRCGSNDIRKLVSSFSCSSSDSGASSGGSFSGFSGGG